MSTVTPENTVLYENLVKTCFMEAAEGERFPDGAALRADITAFYEIPSSTSKKRRHEMVVGRQLPKKKPDLDNIAKVVLDALNGIAYRDDAQVVEILVRKLYGENPRVSVHIMQVEG